MSLFYHSPQYLFTERFEQALFLYRGIIERLQQLILLTASYRFDFPLALVFAQKFGEGFFPTGFITSSAVMSPICSRRRAWRSIVPISANTPPLLKWPAHPSPSASWMTSRIAIWIIRSIRLSSAWNKRRPTMQRNSRGQFCAISYPLRRSHPL